MNAKEILNQLLTDIKNRRFVKSGKLPSEAQLTARFAASRMTVRRALDELKRRGLIEKRNGVGSFLAPRARRHSGMIGLIIPDFDRFSFFATLKREIESHCRRFNFQIELITADWNQPAAVVASVRHQVRKLAALHAEGAVFRPYVSQRFTKANNEITQILKHAEIPVVLIDSDVTPPPKRSNYDLIAVDNIAAGRRIADHLVERAYEHIAFLVPGGSLQNNPNWSNRLFGLAGELALKGHKTGVSILKFRPEDRQAVGRLLRSRNRPDAIVCGNDDCALTLIQTLQALSIGIPEKLAIVGFDDSPQSRVSRPTLTTVSQPMQKIAATAFKSLLARIRYPNNDPREIFLPAPLVPRQST